MNKHRSYGKIPPQIEKFEIDLFERIVHALSTYGFVPSREKESTRVWIALKQEPKNVEEFFLSNSKILELLKNNYSKFVDNRKYSEKFNNFRFTKLYEIEEITLSSGIYSICCYLRYLNNFDPEIEILEKNKVHEFEGIIIKIKTKITSISPAIPIGHIGRYITHTMKIFDSPYTVSFNKRKNFPEINEQDKIKIHGKIKYQNHNFIKLNTKTTSIIEKSRSEKLYTFPEKLPSKKSIDGFILDNIV